MDRASRTPWPTRLAALALLAGAVLSGAVGCASAPPPAVAQGPGLRRDRYVLPPEPPPPQPRTEAEQRALEAEWPPAFRYERPVILRVRPTRARPAAVTRLMPRRAEQQQVVNAGAHAPTVTVRAREGGASAPPELVLRPGQ